MSVRASVDVDGNVGEHCDAHVGVDVTLTGLWQRAVALCERRIKYSDASTRRGVVVVRCVVWHRRSHTINQADARAAPGAPEF